MDKYARKFKDRKVLITGGLGFLGSNLARRLANLGAQVTLLDCLLPNHGGNVFNVGDIAPKVRWIKKDIRDGALMNELLPGQEFFFNIAAQTSHTDSMADPRLDADINIRGQINLLETCRKVNSKVRIVYCSTRAVYGSSESSTLSEDDLPNPLDIYSVHKYAGERYHKIYSAVHNLNTVVLRVANGYGPRAQMKGPSFGILNWFIRLALSGQEIKIFGDGMQVRDYLYVDDVVEAFLAAAVSASRKGEVYNVGSGKGLPLIRIVKDIVRIAGRGKIVHVPWPATNKKIDVGDFIADIRKIRRELKWSPTVPLEEGLRETIRFYEKNQGHYW